MNLLTVLDSEGKVLAIINDSTPAEFEPQLKIALAQNLDAEIVSMHIGEKDKNYGYPVNVQAIFEKGEESEYLTITLTPAYFYGEMPNTLETLLVKGIDYKLLDQQREHLNNLIVNIDRDGDVNVSDGQTLALDGIQNLLDSISDAAWEDKENLITHPDFTDDLDNNVFQYGEYIYKIAQNSVYPENFRLTISSVDDKETHCYDYDSEDAAYKDVKLAYREINFILPEENATEKTGANFDTIIYRDKEYVTRSISYHPKEAGEEQYVTTSLLSTDELSYILNDDINGTDANKREKGYAMDEQVAFFIPDMDIILPADKVLDILNNTFTDFVFTEVK